MAVSPAGSVVRALLSSCLEALEAVAWMSKRWLMAGLSLPLLLALASAAEPARAAAAPGAVDGAALTAERARLRDELDRVGAEIDALKRANRGVGDDYRLRARLADAEALARRLIEIEARLGL